MPSYFYIIAKYADDAHFQYNYGPNYEFSLGNSIYNTYSGRTIGIPEFFNTLKEARIWLKKAKEFNPSVGYAIKRIEYHPS